jgi:flagellar assembly protein FliH
MSMSSSSGASNSSRTPISSLLYRDLAAPLLATAQTKKTSDGGSEKDPENQVPSGPSIKEIEEIVENARSQTRADTEELLKARYEMKAEELAASIRKTIDLFTEERNDYFGRVESEVVHLALAIAAKILHRESQVDPMLVGALVRVATEKLHDGSKVSIRVPPQEVDKWREYMANPLNGMATEVVGDDRLGPLDTLLETDLGSANFSIDAQLKEVEQGFFDLLAQRPENK